MAISQNILYDLTVPGIIVWPVSGDIIEKKTGPVSVTGMPWNDMQMRMPGFGCISAKSQINFKGAGKNSFDSPSVFPGKIEKFIVYVRRNFSYIIKMGSCGNNKPARQ